MPVDIKESLTQKVGPLPAYGWGVILGGGYVFYRYRKAKQAAAAGAANSTVVDTQGPAFGLSQDSASPWGSGNSAGGSGTGSSVVSPTTTTGQSQTNVDWGTLAENWAIAMGFNPTDAATAIGSYLYGTGQQLNATQSSILQQALHQFGTPPEGVIIPPPVTAVPPLQQPAPSAPTTSPLGPPGGFIGPNQAPWFPIPTIAPGHPYNPIGSTMVTIVNDPGGGYHVVSGG